MKTKLTALTLALTPLLAFNSHAAVQIQSTTQTIDDSVLVVFKDNASVAMRAQARQLVKARISDSNADEKDDNYKNVLNGRLAKFDLDGMTPKQAIKLLEKHPAVSYVEPNYIVTALAIPDDSRFDELWGLHNTGQTGGTNDADINAPEAWDISIGSRDVIVGVIDTGVDYNHPDLAANMWLNPGEIAGDGVDNDGNGYVDDVYGINAITDSGDPMDDQGHGTHVSGTIGATGNNALGVVGVNHEVSIVGCKFLNSSGSGSTGDAIKCIDYMVGLKNAGHNVSVLNNSWGGGGFNQALYDSISASEQAGILFVAAAGNSARDNDVSPGYPSSYDHDSVLAVASTTHTDSMSSFSQWGLTSVDLGAPGSNVLSTVPGGGYSSFSGTSMATPHVAGAAALALAVNPSLTTLELKNLLMESGKPIAALDGKTVSGKRLDAHQALIDADPEPGFRVIATPISQQVTAGENADYQLTFNSIANWDGDIALTASGDLNGVTLSKTTVKPGDTAVLSVPTTAETAWGDYSFTVDATSGQLSQQKQVSLTVLPQGLRDFTYDNTTSVDIPDNNQAGVESKINIVDPITIFGSSVALNISHTYISDLLVTLTSPAGTVATLHNRTGGGADDIVGNFASDAFNGEVATGEWTLKVVDNATLDTGTLNNWSVTLTGIGEIADQPPVSGFNFVREGLNVTFTDTSTDVNDDIVSRAWDFGDGNVSDQQNPIHTFAASGTYDVALTVTDSKGNTHTSTQSVIVSSDNPQLEIVRANKTRLGSIRVELKWSGSTAEQVSIYRDGQLIRTVNNTGKFRDFSRNAAATSYTYKLCQDGDICSPEVTVNFQ
ncbi:S8 family serine peptidase [Pseudoalteromonas sp. Of7M-16]|uniref:S8 family serine peptidase n=1 Tax=Pseudoalteromonas sp. Of7M-16 TaxID=2917756 RepID=UPI001EF44199|nr:S8 family serine peptidase [Pseudoalteromonas sp. Of7M-16]MCG7546392.1 S8 family serine peptidase [Pseudoalteromonas sp. Of7M-16]